MSDNRWVTGKACAAAEGVAAAVGFATVSGVAAAYLLDRYVLHRGRQQSDSS